MGVNTIVRAFDRLAPRYDEACSGVLFRWMRDQVHERLAQAFPPGSRVLEIGCGSGLDTAFLVRQDVHVVACDPAPAMIQRARERLCAIESPGRAQLICCGVNDLDAHLSAPLTFDGIVSNFGALNCVPRLDALGRLAIRRLRPGGRVIVGLMSRTCAIEMGWFLLKGDRQRAFRRLRRPPVPVNVEGLEVPTWYHGVAHLQAALGPTFALRRLTGLAVAVPPPYLEARWTGTPRPVRRAAEAIDRAVATSWPFNRLGDHLMAEFEDVRM